jgi:hypothetical protein
MHELDIERLERAIDNSYHEGRLNETAKTLLDALNIETSKQFKLHFGKETNSEIRKSVLNMMTKNWKNFYSAKKSISAYFIDMCKMGYAGEVYKMMSSVSGI